MESQPAIGDYLQRFVGQDFHEGPDEALRAATDRAEAAGVRTTAPDVGALLRWLAALGPARSAVEIGGTAGTSGLWLLGGMAAKPTLTSIEPNPESQDLGRRAYSAAGMSDHVRSILGQPAQVLPRLADNSYDLALLNDDHAGWPEHLEHVVRMLRPGGLLIAVDALQGGAVTDPAVTDPAVTAVRTFNATVRDDDRWRAVLLPNAGGLLLARSQPQT